MKKIRIICNGINYTDVREDYRCPHPTIKGKTARFRRVYSNEGDSLVIWDWTEKEIIHPAQGMKCSACKKIIGTNSSCKNCLLFNKSKDDVKREQAEVKE